MSCRRETVALTPGLDGWRESLAVAGRWSTGVTTFSFVQAGRPAPRWCPEVP
jgi:hypothetical protein